MTRIPLTQDMIDALRAEMRRTKLGSIAFMKRYGHVHTELTKNILETIRTGSSKTVEQHIYEAIMRTFAWLPDGKRYTKNLRGGYVPLTPQMIDALNDHMMRTRLGSSAFIKKHGASIDGLNLSKLESMRAGRVHMADKAVYDTVIQIYASLPDGLRHTNNVAADRISLTKPMADLLKAEIERTKVSLSVFLKRYGAGRQYASLKTLTSIRDGTVGSVDKKMYDNLIKKYNSLPDS